MSKLFCKSVALALAVLFALSSCRFRETDPPASSLPIPDPHEGQVRVHDGWGQFIWVPLIESLAPNSLDAACFSPSGGFLAYADADVVSVQGIDVSSYQQEIDWAQVAESSVEFAIIQAGYRGYSEGGIYEDKRFRENLNGAHEAGLDVGLYFFSQAINAHEAEEEAEFVLSLINGQVLTLPIFFDWEHIGHGDSDARTDDLSGEILTDCALAFARVIENAGYRAGVYFSRSLGYHCYDLARLEDLVFWSCALGSFSDFYYAHSYWQYSITGTVPGIDGHVDLNLRFVPISRVSPDEIPSPADPHHTETASPPLQDNSPEPPATAD